MLLITALLFVILFIITYLIGAYNERYWKKLGVPFYGKNKVMGIFWDFLTENRAMFQIVGDLYKQHPNEPAVGFGSFLTPSLLIRDFKNVQHVMNLDFHSFNHRGIEVLDGDQLSDNILLMHGSRWKLMRQTMSPLFTSAKLKNMYYIMDKSAQDFVEFLKDNPDKLDGNAFETLTAFSSAAVGATVFGINAESIFDSPFLSMARKAFQSTFITNIKFSVIALSITLTKALGIKLFTEFEVFFVEAINNVIQKRKEDNVIKNDFADLCVSLQKQGMLRDVSTGCELEPTTGLLAAQAFFFFIAGVEPSATVLFCVLLELGQNPEILQRVHKEIDNAFDKNNGQLSHDAVMDMEYIDKVLNESMRMYPPIGFLMRKCVNQSVLPVGNIKIEKGTKIFTPIFDIHHDEKHFPNPEVFDPERFARDGSHMLSSEAYMPFGKGHRNCIGARYARLQMKAGLVHLLRNFTVKPIIGKGGIKFKKEQIQVRPTNVDVLFIPRDIKIS